MENEQLSLFKQAKWITRSPWIEWRTENDPERFPPSPYIARSFEVKKPPQKAVLHIAGLGQAAYYLNGSRIPDSYRPTQVTNPTMTVLYRSFDITALIKEGRNRIGVTLGNNRYHDRRVSRWSSTTKMIADLRLTYQDGTTEQLVSDTSWKTADSPTLFSMTRCGERYDARREIPDWCSADFDDSDWDNAHICKGPGGLLRATACPPVRVKKEIPGKEIAPGLFDFGENVSGWVHLTVSGPRDTEVTVKYAERLTEDKKHVDQKYILANIYGPMAHKDVCILKGGKQEFEQLFSFHGFRYVEVEGGYSDVRVTAMVAYTDIQPTAEFFCDNETVNRIHELCTRSILTNCQDVLLDCPHREQNEWTGDGMLSAESVNIGFDCYGMFYEWMMKFKDDQLPDGTLPCIIPSKDAVWEYNFANGPDWDSAIFHIPYYTFRYSGDRRIVDDMWENMNRSLHYFSTLSENCLLRAGVGDWASSGETCDKEITDTAYYRIDALMMAEMAEATGRDAAPYRELAEKIKADFRKKYVKDGILTETHQTTYAAAIFAGMLDGEEIAVAAGMLARRIAEDGYHFICGVHGLRMVFDALSANGYTQLLFDTVVNPEYPGYGNVVKCGLTTLPERFDYVASLNHQFRSMVDAWFYKYLAGIRVRGFGFEQVEIDPVYVEGITRLEATLKGIRVSYDSEKLTVNSPYPFAYRKKTYPAGDYVFQK